MKHSKDKSIQLETITQKQTKKAFAGSKKGWFSHLLKQLGNNLNLSEISKYK